MRIVFEEGRYYKTRGGKVVGPAKRWSTSRTVFLIGDWLYENDTPYGHMLMDNDDEDGFDIVGYAD